MDTLVAKSLQIILANQDSLSHKISETNKLIAKQAIDNSNAKYLPLLAALAATILTLAGQFLLKEYDARKSCTLEKRGYKNKIIQNVVLLKFYLTELAYLRIDLIFQFYLSETEAQEDDRKTATEEHYNDYKYITDINNKIAQVVSEINSSLNCYFECKKTAIPQNILSELNQMTSNLLKLERPDYYLSTDKITDAITKQHCVEYTQKYFSHVTKFEQLINSIS